jgi:glycoprotein endo-alpha-1,2-mannosidase
MKTNGRRALYMFLFAALAFAPAVMPLGAAAAADEPPPEVVIFYYPWYETPQYDGQWRHWQERGHAPSLDIASDYYPLLGAYSSFDPEVVEQHMRWMLQAGASIVAVSWWGPGSPEDIRLPLLLAQATRFNLKVAFLVEPYYHTPRSAATLADDIAYLYRRYGWSPAFYRTTRPSLYSPDDGRRRGLFFFWAPGYQYEGGPLVDRTYWRPALDAIHALPDGGIVLASGMETDWIEASHFDGQWNYAIPHLPPGQMARWAWSLPPGAWFVPCVTPGFSARRIGYPAGTFYPRNDGATYDFQWKEALNTGIQPQMVGVATFNEWHEGTQIEPAAAGATDGFGFTYDDYGDLGPTGYLTATVRWAERLVALPPAPDYRDAPSVSVSLGEHNAVQGLLHLDVGGDGLTEAVDIEGLSARRLADNPTEVRYLYLWVHNDFVYAQETSLEVEVDYLDLGEGTFGIEYDSTHTVWPFQGAYKATAPITLTNSGQWRTARFSLPDAFLGGRQNDHADLRIFSSDNNLYVRRVKISNPAAKESEIYLPVLQRQP